MEKKFIQKNIKFSVEQEKMLKRVVAGMKARQQAVLPEVEFKTTQTGAIMSALSVMEKLLIQEGYLEE